MIGKRLLHYRIDAELGRGGMGVVYRAFDEKLRRDVALKVLQDKLLGSPDHRGRLLAEARAASPLNHPSIATIYEVAEHEDMLVIVMEFAEGDTLRTALESSLEPRKVIKIAIQVAEALEAAHQRSIVHGDVKPDNVVLRQDGGIKLLDFGVARSFSSEAVTATLADVGTATSGGVKIAGTLAYMAPERFRGSEADPRSDLFSVGVMLFEAACGRRPFPGPDATSTVHQILEDPAPKMESAANAPPELCRIARKLMEKDVDARYQTASDLRVDLTNLLRDLDTGPVITTGSDDRRTVAVLPFHLLVRNREDEYLSVALADAIINGLGTSPQLLLRPSSALQRYAKERPDPLVAARELDVDLIVEGNIQKLGPQMRVHVQVWRAADGSTLLSTKHDAQVTDLFALQDRIVESLFDVFGVGAGESAATPPTENPHAYELFLRAVERLSYGNVWDTRTAVEMLRSVVQLDPAYAEAWARLAQACIHMGFSFEPDPHWTDEAEEAIEKALSLDPTNVLARVGQGRVAWSPDRGFQNRPALKALGDAVRIDPHSHQAIVWQSLIFLHVGLLAEAQAGLTEALTIEPNDAFSLNFMAQVLGFQGDYERAERYHQQSLANDPTHQFTLLFRPNAFLQLGQFDRVEQEIKKAQAILGEDKMLQAIEAMLWARRGDPHRAGKALALAEGDSPTLAHSHHVWHYIGATHAMLERPDDAVRWLDRAAKTGLPNYPLFDADPHLDGLRGHAGFDALLGRLKAECNAYREEFVDRS